MNTEKEKELEILKQKYGKVRTLTVPLDDEDESKNAVIFLKKPDNSTRNMVNSLVQKDKTFQAIEACLKALAIGGDDLKLVLENDDALASCEPAIVELLSVQKATLKKN